jgi:hypothetical protein
VFLPELFYITKEIKQGPQMEKQNKERLLIFPRESIELPEAFT